MNKEREKIPGLERLKKSARDLEAGNSDDPKLQGRTIAQLIDILTWMADRSYVTKEECETFRDNLPAPSKWQWWKMFVALAPLYIAVLAIAAKLLAD